METNITKWRIYLWPLAVLVLFLAFHKVGDLFRRQGADLDLKNAALSTQGGAWNDALDFCDKALVLDPQNVEARYSRGGVYLDRNQAGDMEKALEDFRGAGQIMPDYRMIHFKEYETLTRLNRTEEAQMELKRAVRLDPMLIYLLDDFKRARILASAGHLSESLIIYQNLYFDYPTCVPMLIDYANCFAMAGDYTSAINLYRRTLALDPGNSKAFNDLKKVSEVMQRAREMKNPRVNILGGELE